MFFIGFITGSIAFIIDTLIILLAGLKYTVIKKCILASTYHYYLAYLPMYKSMQCVSRPPILEPKKNSFISNPNPKPLFLGKNFLEKLIFYLRIFFQVHYGYTKKDCPELFLMSVFDYVYVKGDFFDWYLGCKRSTYTRVNTVVLII